MSRIDEALARAQHAKTHDISADTAPMAGLNIDFPAEAGEEPAAPEAKPASVQVRHRVVEPAAVPSDRICSYSARLNAHIQPRPRSGTRSETPAKAAIAVPKTKNTASTGGVRRAAVSSRC